jgi:hypothetical protein
MPRSMVALLAAVGTALSVLGAIVPSHVALLIMAAGAATATGSAAFLAIPPDKKQILVTQESTGRKKQKRPGERPTAPPAPR